MELNSWDMEVRKDRAALVRVHSPTVLAFRMRYSLSVRVILLLGGSVAQRSVQGLRWPQLAVSLAAACAIVTHRP